METEAIHVLYWLQFLSYGRLAVWGHRHPGGIPYLDRRGPDADRVPSITWVLNETCWQKSHSLYCLHFPWPTRLNALSPLCSYDRYPSWLSVHFPHLPDQMTLELLCILRLLLWRAFFLNVFLSPGRCMDFLSFCEEIVTTANSHASFTYCLYTTLLLPPY